MSEKCMLCRESKFKDTLIDDLRAEFKDISIELKLDGDRVLFVQNRLLNRRGLDITHKYPQIKIDNENTITDGEVCFFDTDNLKTLFNLGRQKINWANCVYVIFDVLQFEGLNLKDKPLNPANVLSPHH